MPTLEYYFATISPYVYLAGTRMEEVAAKHGVDIVYKPIDLASLFSRTGGVALSERHPSRQEYRLQDLARSARKAGLPMNMKPMFFPANPAPSAYAVIGAQNAGGGDLGKLVFSLTRACWAEERDVSQDDVIKDCLEGAGFDPAITDTGLLSGAETFTSNLEEAVRKGVFGAPFYITEDDQRFWGHDRIADLDAHLGGNL